MRVLVASTSAVKLQAVREIWPEVEGIAIAHALPAQPINSGLVCAHRRLDALLSQPADLYLAIENGIDTIDYLKDGDNTHFIDVCYVVAQRNGQRYEAASFGIPVEKRIVAQAMAQTAPNYAHRDLGLEVTAGELLHKRDGVAADNWMADPRHGGIDRTVQIQNALQQLYLRLQ